VVINLSNILGYIVVYRTVQHTIIGRPKTLTTVLIWRRRRRFPINLMQEI